MSDVEPRLITESSLDARIASIVEPVIEGLGFRLVRVRILNQNGKTVQIMAERPDGTINVADCEAISTEVSPALDVEDPISGAYHLEVSSPGIDRPLVRLSDFDRWSGHVAKVELAVPMQGRRRFRGTLLGTEDGNVGIELAEVLEGEESRIWLAGDNLSDAKLIMTDELIAEAGARTRNLTQPN